MIGWRQDENLSGFFGKPVWIREIGNDEYWYALFTKEAIYVSVVSNYALAAIGDVLLSRHFSHDYLVFQGKIIGESPWKDMKGTPPGDASLWLLMNCWSLI